ncbi:UNVERIFIED_CONTAM: hypothetical protein PYX00_009176 [Menopon gallinae]|uniref:Uncharacterized protein n=1 Tax=Menopon gallinae TaxID=328185 RepID=A0AAW2HA86_9NEOP
MDESEADSVSLTSLLENSDSARFDSDFSESDCDGGDDTLLYIDTSKAGVLARSLKWGGLKKVSFPLTPITHTFPLQPDPEPVGLPQQNPVVPEELGGGGGEGESFEPRD